MAVLPPTVYGHWPGISSLAVAVTLENGPTPQDPSVTRAELRSVAADLRYTGGYLLNVVAQSAVDCDLDPADDELARFCRPARPGGAVGAAQLVT